MPSSMPDISSSRMFERLLSRALGRSSYLEFGLLRASYLSPEGCAASHGCFRRSCALGRMFGCLSTQRAMKSVRSSE